MKLPKTLKLGPFDFRLTRHQYNANKEDHLGWISQSKQEISIADDVTDDCQREVVLHELLHGAWMLASLNKFNGMKEYEELIVNCISTQLMGIFRDNKQLKDVLFA